MDHVFTIHYALLLIYFLIILTILFENNNKKNYSLKALCQLIQDLETRDPFVRGAFNEVGNNSLSLQQKVEDLIKRVDAQDQKIQYLEKYKEKSKQTIIKMYREVAVQKRVLSVMENSLLLYIKRLTEETEIAVENKGSGASSQGVSTIGLNQRTRECMQGKSGVQVRKSSLAWFFNVNEDEGSSFIFKLFVASLAALTIYACAFKAKEAIEAWFNEVVYPLRFWI